MKRTVMLLATFALYTPASFISAFWFPQLLSNFIDMRHTAELMQIISYGVPLGCLLGAFLAERGGRKISLVLLIAGAGISSLAMFMASSRAMVSAAGFMIQIFNMSSAFILFAYTVEQYPTRIRNSAGGLLNGLGRFAVSGAQPLVVLILSGGDPQNMFLGTAILYFASLPLLLLWGRRTAGMALEDSSRGDRPSV